MNRNNSYQYIMALVGTKHGVLTGMAYLIS